MIAAVLVLSLISLLVATEPGSEGTPVHPSPEPPFRPARKPADNKTPETDRMAA
jgi:hypothetical protein